VGNAIHKTHYYAILYYSKIYLIQQYLCQQQKSTDSFPFLLEVKCNLLRNNKQKYSVLYSDICVIIIWEYKILPAQRLRSFPEIYMFLISSFKQFALLLWFIIFEFCHILKNPLRYAESLICNFFWILHTRLNMYLHFPVFHFRPSSSMVTNRFAVFFFTEFMSPLGTYSST
jgi:hypothetical protein